MASHYWIKLYHEILNDPKMGRLPDRAWRRAIELFLLAGETDDNGNLPTTDNIAWRLHIPEDELIKDLELLAEADIVTQNSDQWSIPNFAKRQAPTPNTERQQQYRDKQQKEQYYKQERNEERNEECNANTTERYVDTDTDTDTDKDSAPEAPKTKPTKTRKAKTARKPKTPVPPAVLVFRQNTHRFPAKAWYDDIVEVVGDDSANLAVWGKIVKAWVGMGWKPTNVTGMLDFYKRGEIPPGTKQGAPGSPKTPGQLIRKPPADDIPMETRVMQREALAAHREWKRLKDAGEDVGPAPGSLENK